MDEHIDRSGIERNAGGSEEPHSVSPQLWNFDGTEVDLAPGHQYVFGGQLWYVSARAREMHSQGVSVAGRPMNRAARESDIKGLPPPRPGSVAEDAPAALDDDDEMAGLEGLEEEPPKAEVYGPSGRVYKSISLFCLRVSRAGGGACAREGRVDGVARGRSPVDGGRRTVGWLACRQPPQPSLQQPQPHSHPRSGARPASEGCHTPRRVAGLRPNHPRDHTRQLRHHGMGFATRPSGHMEGGIRGHVRVGLPGGLYH